MKADVSVGVQINRKQKRGDGGGDGGRRRVNSVWGVFVADALLLQCRQRRQAGTMVTKQASENKTHLCLLAGCCQRCRMDFLSNKTGGNALSCSSLLSQIL